MQISEIFYSFQGEGPLIGFPQIFIRLFGCNLTCDYCDETNPRYHDYSVDDIIKISQPLFKKKPHSISLTGGEPLLQVNAIKKLCPKLKLPIYLETNGTLPHQLTKIVNDIDWFSVDYKPSYENEFIEFISILRNKKNVFIKYIVTKNFLSQEIQKLAKIISSINVEIPLILQPVTPSSGYKEKATEADIIRAFDITRKYVSIVRIIPQTHKLMNIK